MKMILQLLVAAVAIGLGVDAGMVTPPYKQYVQAMKDAADIIKKNVLSMEGDIPLLNDSRRHYAEIVHVINYHAISESGGVRREYYEAYPHYLNISAAEAINHPEQVIDYIKLIQDQVHKEIDELLELIHACVEEADICDKLIDDTVKANKDQYGNAAKILDLAGRAAIALNELNVKIEPISRDLKAHVYVCTTPEDFEEIVDVVSELHRAVNGPCVPALLKC